MNNKWLVVGIVALMVAIVAVAAIDPTLFAQIRVNPPMTLGTGSMLSNLGSVRSALLAHRQTLSVRLLGRI